MKKIVNIINIMLIILTIVWGFLIYKNFELQSKEVITSSGVLERIQSISELNTVEMYFNEIIDYENAKYFHNIEIPFTKKTFIFTAKAKVKSGIDIKDFSENDILINGGHISLTLPTPTITSIEILEYKVYDEKDGLFNKIRNEDTFKALDQFKVSLEKQALDNGILEKAKEDSADSFRILLNSLGFDTVEILFR